MNIRQLAAVLMAGAAGLLAACGGGDGISGTGSAAGTLRVALTDAPACGYDAVNVTVQKLRVHRSATALETDDGWSEIVLNPAFHVDLLSLRNGVLAELGETPLPAGRYTQMRLVLAKNSNAAPWANSVVPTGGSEAALDTPSAAQSGLKLNVDIDVPADKVADVVLDFDACKSIVKAGNSGKFILKPVISVITRLSDAGLRIVGYVDPPLAASGVAISAQQAGLPVKATLADATGKFVLYPVPAGRYDLVISATGRATAVMTGVPVITTAYTYVNSTTTAFAPPPLAAPLRQVSGTVTPATGTVRALQHFTGGGPTFEAAWASVDPTTGDFSFALPVAAPLIAAYAPIPAVPVFVADLPAAGQYTVEASFNGLSQTRLIDALSAVPPIAFVFP